MNLRISGILNAQNLNLKTMKKASLLVLVSLLCLFVKSQDAEVRQLKVKLTQAEAAFPTSQKIDQSTKLTAKGKSLFKQLRQVIVKGSQISERTPIGTFLSLEKTMDSALNAIGVSFDENGKLSVAKMRQSGVFTTIGINSMSGEGGCTERCNAVYNTCMSANDCTRGGWICLCCSGCSLVFATCMASCAIG
jgi:hypothetical protein